MGRGHRRRRRHKEAERLALLDERPEFNLIDNLEPREQAPDPAPAEQTAAPDPAPAQE